MKRLWDSLGKQRSSGARLGLVVGAAAIVIGTAAAGWWFMRPDYQVLFADLSPQDASAMSAELDRLKIPYVLGDAPGGDREAGAILVDKSDVYRTRMKLMAKDLPLHGTVGFELFNNGDIGMTEFAQKINFQRALQGELTRTILALAEVRDARILLALPEQGLFRQAAAKPTAAVTLSLKAGQRLQPAQVNGIQRLVASAVPGIQAQDVTIVDQSGVALTRPAGDPADAAGSARLDLKQETEAYLARKATAVLERTLGAGNVTASVDVTLNMDRVQTNTDEVIGAPVKAGELPTGFVSRERESTREIGAPVAPAGNAAAAAGGSSQHETEYTLGHRVEQVVGQPGSIRRIQVAVVVRHPLTPSQQEQLRQTVAAAVGASTDRGDTVVVQSTVAFDSARNAAARLDAVAGVDADAAQPPMPGTASSRAAAIRAGEARGTSQWLVLLAVFGVLGLLAVLASRALRRARPAPGVRPLTHAERQEMLEKLRGWMNEEVPEVRSLPEGRGA
jgi:flagellar M-ring protein FliF